MSQPVVASYCTTFLKKEMRHIYRQVTGLQEFKTFVLTRCRENEDVYPFDDVEILLRPRTNFLRRFYRKHIRRMPAIHYRGEYDQLIEVLRRREVDLMHVYFGHTGVHLLPFLQAWPIPALVSFHGMDIMTRDDQPSYAGKLKELLQTVPMVLARSESLADRLVALGCDRGKIRLNRTSIPLDGFPYQDRQPPSDGAWKFIQASRFIAKKGLEVTLKSFARTKNTYPNAELILAGAGPLEESLKRQATELGILSSVTFTGFLDQEALAKAYREAHVFVHPSQTTETGDQEGVPNAMLEAMAMGLPVVATLHGGIPEAVTSESTGLLVPERDVDAFTAALERLCGDGALYQTLSRNASESVRQNFEQSRSIARLEAAYRELLGSSPKAAA